MLTLPLEPTDDRANPVFKNPSSCKKWLSQLQLTNLQAAHTTLRTQLDEFNRCPVRGLDRLQTLEILREMIHYVQNDYGKRLVGKALPLSELELGILTATTGLWQSMFTGYQRCLQAYQAGDKQLASYGAMLCHRCMMYGGRQIFEHMRTGYEFDGKLWQQLHALYAFAEEHKLLSTEVQDELSEHERRSSCHNIYLKTLLSCQARPQELSLTQQQLLDTWLSHWVTTITVDRTFAISKGDAPPLSIDLAGTSCLQTVISGPPVEDDNTRYLAMIPVSKLLRVKTILLQQGHTPRQLELGDNADSTDCLELLTHLHKQWCEVRPEREHDRYGATQEVTVCYGLEDGFSFVANQPFNPSKKPVRESWRTEDISMLGARLLRADVNGVRLNANRIIAVQITGDTAFKLGRIIWVSITPTGHLHLGIRFLPGEPKAMIIKEAATSSTKIAAMVLPEMPNLGIPASLVIPRNIYQPGRTLEGTLVPGNEKMQIKLGISVEKGVDYERVSFTPA